MRVQVRFIVQIRQHKGATDSFVSMMEAGEHANVKGERKHSKLFNIHPDTPFTLKRFVHSILYLSSGSPRIILELVGLLTYYQRCKTQEHLNASSGWHGKAGTEVGFETARRAKQRLRELRKDHPEHEMLLRYEHCFACLAPAACHGFDS